MDSTTHSNFFSDILSPFERKRLNRQLRLPGWNQEALKKSKVLIAGVGGLGTEIAKNLAMAGVGVLHLVDMDTIEHSNLNRQILFTEADEGEPKAVVAARNLKKINPHVNYVAHYCRLEELDPGVYEEADVYVSGLDSAQARKELIRRAVHNKKPLVDGGTITYYGHIYSYVPDKNACLECDPLKERERETLAACTLVGKPRKRSHCLLKGQLYFESTTGRTPDVENIQEMTVVVDYANKLVAEHFPNEKPFSFDEAVAMIDYHEPTVITINAVIASYQSQEVIKILHHQKGIPLGTINLDYTIYNGLTGKFFYLEKPRNKECLLCGSRATPLKQLVVPPSTVVSTLRILVNKMGYDYDPEVPPNFYRIDGVDIEPIEDSYSLQEAKVRDGETLYLMGLWDKERETDLYLKIRYPRDER